MLIKWVEMLCFALFVVFILDILHTPLAIDPD